MLPDNPPITISNRFCSRGKYSLTQSIGSDTYGDIYSGEFDTAQQCFDRLSHGDVACVIISHGALRVKGDW